MRVTNTMISNTLLTDIQSNQERILSLQRQSSTGHRIVDISDDPIGTVSSLNLQSTIDRQNQYLANIDAGKTRLGMTDSSLGDLNNIYTQMKALILQMSDDSQSADSRAAAASTVSAALSQVVAIANRSVAGQALFAGSKTDVTPFVSQGGGIVYKGNTAQIQASVSDGQQVPINLTGVDVFGAVSSQVQGIKDLNPAATTASKLVDLNNGRGVHAGSVTLGDGFSTQTMDLSASETLGDVINKLNTNTIGITASITTTGGAGGQSRITLTKAGFTLSVSEVNGNTTAADLGIKNTGTLSPLNGTDLDPRLTDLTTIASLNNGTGGVDLVDGLLVKNGANSGTVTFTGALAIQDIRNKLIDSGLFMDAQISSDGRKLNLVSTLNGAEFRVAGNGGTTGSDLGVLSLVGGTSLSGLNRGLGVRKASDPTTADFRITQRNGVNTDVNISTANTVQDVINAINLVAPATLVASLSTTGGNGILLTDTSGGAGNLSVSMLNDSFAARDLGLLKSVAAGTLTGDDVNPILTGSIFSILSDLQSNLIANNTIAIGNRGTELDAAFTTLLNSRAVAGSRTQQLDMTSNRLQDEQTQVKGALSGTLDADLASVLTQLSQEQVSLQAALKVSATALQLSLVNFL